MNASEFPPAFPAARAETADLAQLPDLTQLIDECSRAGASRNALLLSARRMPADLARPHHLRLAFEALLPLTMADRARVFYLPDGSRVLTWRGDAGPLLTHALATLAHLVADEPGIAEAKELAQLYSLPCDGAQMLADIHGTPPRPISLRRQNGKNAEKLDPTSLQSLEQALAQVNVSRFARHRRVWRVVQGGRLETAWDKRFLSVTDLTESLLPGRDPTADPWLFRRLTRTLDRRLLSLLGAPDELRAAGPFSLDLNVGTLLAPEFLRFDAAVPPHLRGKLVIDLLPADILADPAGFVFARGFARARRYRLMIREVSPALCAALDFVALDPDLVELEYSKAAAIPECLPPGCELMLAYSNHSGQIDQQARAFAAGGGIKLLAPRD